MSRDVVRMSKIKTRGPEHNTGAYKHFVQLPNRYREKMEELFGKKRPASGLFADNPDSIETLKRRSDSLLAAAGLKPLFGVLNENETAQAVDDGVDAAYNAWLDGDAQAYVRSTTGKHCVSKSRVVSRPYYSHVMVIGVGDEHLNFYGESLPTLDLAATSADRLNLQIYGKAVCLERGCLNDPAAADDNLAWVNTMLALPSDEQPDVVSRTARRIAKLAAAGKLQAA